MLQLEWSNGNTQNYAVLLTLEISGTVILKREKLRKPQLPSSLFPSTVLSWVDTPSTPLPVNGSQPRGGSKEGRQLLAFHFSVSEKVGKEENIGFRGHLFLLSLLSNPTSKPTSRSCYFLKNKLGTRSPLATFSATTENKPFWAAPTHETAKPPSLLWPSFPQSVSPAARESLPSPTSSARW